MIFVIFGEQSLIVDLIPNNIKLILFIPNLSGGGAERVFVNLAEIFTERGIDVELVVGNAVGELAPFVKNIKVIDLQSSSVIRSIIPLIRHIQKSKPNIILSGMAHANLAAIIATKSSFTRCKVISSVHENIFFASKHISFYEKFILTSLKFAYFFCNGFTAVSRDLLISSERYYIYCLPHQRTFIYNPIIKDLGLINSRKFWYLDTGKPFKIISAGRLSLQKNFSVLIKAFSKLEDKRNFTLTIYGEGPERSALEKLISDLQLEELIKLPGYTHNLADELAQSDLFVMTSLWEGFGNVLVEALAAGCQVISSDCESGPREILSDGKYGQLIPVNDVDALVKAINKARSGPKPLFGLDMLKPFTFKSVGNQYIKLFEAVSGKNFNEFINE